MPEPRKHRSISQKCQKLIKQLKLLKLLISSSFLRFSAEVADRISANVTTEPLTTSETSETSETFDSFDGRTADFSYHKHED